MGSVHQQTTNEGRGCEEFYHISLSEVNTIKSLIINRSEFDPCFKSNVYYNSHPCITNGIPLFQEPVAVLYLDLEKLIEECNLNKYHKFIIHCLMCDYDYEFIAEFLKWTTDKVDEMFNHACKIIKEQNDYDWKRCLENNGTIKKPTDTKICGRCGKDLKTSSFGKDKRNKDGLQSFCKKCDSYRKKLHK